MEHSLLERVGENDTCAIITPTFVTRLFVTGGTFATPLFVTGGTFATPLFVTGGTFAKEIIVLLMFMSKTILLQQPYQKARPSE